MAPPVIISVEAAIATGKSTLLNLVQKKLGKRVHIIQEPVAEWQAIEGNSDHNVLEKFYDDMSRWSFSFQQYVLFTVVRAMQETVDKLEREGTLDDTVLLIERSYYTGRHTFAKMLHESGFISGTEWQMYKGWWDWIVEKGPKICGHIYMRTSVDTVMQRLKKRNRGEECSITAAYQTSLIEKHEEWVASCEQSGVPMLILDAEVNFLQDELELDSICDQIRTFFDSFETEDRGSMKTHQKLSCDPLRVLTNGVVLEQSEECDSTDVDADSD